MLGLDEFKEVLVHLSEGLVPLFASGVDVNNFLAAEVNGTEEVSKLGHKFLLSVTAHEPGEEVDRVLEAPKVAHDLTARSLELDYLLFLVPWEVHKELERGWLLASLHRHQHSLLALQHVKVEVNSLHELLNADVFGGG